MPPTLFNTDAEHAENFKGHAEIFDSPTWFKSDSLLSWVVLTRADSEKHYSTNGDKKKTSTGDSSTFEMRVKRGADWYSASGGSETRTITSFKKDIYGKPRKIPTITLRGVSETNAASNKYVVDEFVAYVENIDEIREEGKGTEEIVISGEIKSHTSNIRQAAAP